MGKFVPVSDPEKARSEQDEESLRKHRQFDTPHAHLKKDLNAKREPKGNMEPMGKPTGELELDENTKLWKKKQSLFEKEKTWGRETFQMGNQEEANVDGKKTRDVMAEALFGRAIGFKGGRGNDDGQKVVQRNEVDQNLEKNEKGLWVKKKREPNQKEEEPLTGDDWRCPKCKAVNIRKRHLCKDCQFDRACMAEESSLMKSVKKGEDPRLEAAAKKGRGTADAAAQALKALEARRSGEKQVQDDMGLTKRPDRPKGGGKSSAYGALNSSAQQVHASHRHQRCKQWQGVHRSTEDARKVVAHALGEAAVPKPSSSAIRPAGVSGDLARARPKKRSRSRSRDCSLSVSPSDDEAPPREDAEGAGKDVVVDFF